jgi:hypothetical protein
VAELDDVLGVAVNLGHADRSCCHLFDHDELEVIA